MDESESTPELTVESPTPVKRRGNPKWIKGVKQSKPASQPRPALAPEAAEEPVNASPVEERKRRAFAKDEQAFRGRNGEILTRRRKDGVDIFDIPLSLIHKGWEYQWCAISVMGNKEILMDQNLGFAENGWRPVMAERYEGMYMPVGHKGAIVRGQQMLMERPKAMCDEARADDEAKARKQMRDRDQSLLGGRANVRGAMKDGFEMGGKYRGTGGDLRMSIDPAIDIPAPQHKLADDQ